MHVLRSMVNQRVSVLKCSNFLCIHINLFVTENVCMCLRITVVKEEEEEVEREEKEEADGEEKEEEED